RQLVPMAAFVEEREGGQGEGGGGIGSAGRRARVSSMPPCVTAQQGLGHIFNRLSQATRLSDLEQAAVFWLRRTLDMRQAGHGLGGYRSAENDPRGGFVWTDDPGLLTGAAGTALALHAAISSHEPDWDRMLLLSFGWRRPCDGLI